MKTRAEKRTTDEAPSTAVAPAASTESTEPAAEPNIKRRRTDQQSRASSTESNSRNSSISSSSSNGSQHSAASSSNESTPTGRYSWENPVLFTSSNPFKYKRGILYRIPTLLYGTVAPLRSTSNNVTNHFTNCGYVDLSQQNNTSSSDDSVQ